MKTFKSYLLTFACADYAWTQSIISTRGLRAVTTQYSDYLEAGETLTVELAS